LPYFLPSAALCADQRRLLHEDVIGRIADAWQPPGATKSEIADVKDSVERRLDPLEAAVRDHAKRIGRLEKPRA
jgi:hypothetical protein